MIKSEWKSLDLFKALSTKPKQIRHCKACGASDHNKRNSKCPNYAENAAAIILQQKANNDDDKSSDDEEVATNNDVHQFMVLISDSDSDNETS